MRKAFLVLVSLTLCFFVACPPFSELRHTNGVSFFRNNPVVWRQEDFPLIVAADDTVDDSDRFAMVNAVYVWNERVGREVFVYSDSLLIGHQITFSQSDVPDITQGITQAICWQRSYEGRMLEAQITIDDLTPPSDSAIVLIHELGHALGLTHDSFIGSVMYPSAVDSAGVILEDDARFVLWQMNGGNSEQSN